MSFWLLLGSMDHTVSSQLQQLKKNHLSVVVYLIGSWLMVTLSVWQSEPGLRANLARPDPELFVSNLARGAKVKEMVWSTRFASKGWGCRGWGGWVSRYIEKALCKLKLLGGYVFLFVGRSGVTVDIEEPRDAVLVTNGDSEIGQVSLYLHVFFFPSAAELPLYRVY